MSKEKSMYGVKIGKRLYVESWCGPEYVEDGDWTLERHEAKRWPLSEISVALEAAEFFGGRVVRFKVRRETVVVGERDAVIEPHV